MQPKGLCIATRCTSIDEFIATFHPLCDETSLFVATRGTRAIGVESPFAILLADNTPALCGWCRVVDAWFDSSSPFGCPGIRISVHRLTTASQDVFTQMQAARIAANPPRRVTQPITTRVVTTTTFGGPPRPRQRTITIPPLAAQPRTTAELPAIPRPGTERRAAAPQPRLERLAVPEPAEREERTEPMARSSGAIVQPVRIQTTLRVPTSLPRTKTVPRLAVHNTATMASGSGRFPVSDARAWPARARPTTGSPSPVAAEGSREMRTPGSAVVLPANPLMDLTDETLEGFIECKLYEETNTFFATAEAAQRPEPIGELSAADLEELSLEDVERAVDNLWRPGNEELAFEDKTREYTAETLRNRPLATPPPLPQVAREPVPEPQPVPEPPPLAASEPEPAPVDLTLFEDEQPTIACPELAYGLTAHAEESAPAPAPDVATYSLRPRWPLAVAITVSAIVLGFTISYATLRWGSQSQDPNAIVNQMQTDDR